MRKIVVTLICLMSVNFLLAWGANGHRIIAAICERHLNDAAKEEIQKFLGKDYLAELATWPDYVRSEKGWDFAEKWHYTTVHPDQTVAEVRNYYQRDSSINDAIEAIVLMKDILSDDQKAIDYLEFQMQKHKARPFGNSTKATALAFLVHLIGDIHQPLHVGKNRDLGGNKISVLFFSERTNIHSVWDTKIIEHEKLSYTEFARFIDKLSPDEMNACQAATINDWANESIELREKIYNTLYDYTDRETGLPSFSWDYQHDNIVHVKSRLVKGGVRLAGVLNALFG